MTRDKYLFNIALSVLIGLTITAVGQTPTGVYIDGMTQPAPGTITTNTYATGDGAANSNTVDHALYADSAGGTAGMMSTNDFVRGTGASNTNKVDHASYADTAGGTSGMMTTNDFVRGTGASNTNKVDHSVYADTAGSAVGGMTTNDFVRGTGILNTNKVDHASTADTAVSSAGVSFSVSNAMMATASTLKFNSVTNSDVVVGGQSNTIAYLSSTALTNSMEGFVLGGGTFTNKITAEIEYDGTDAANNEIPTAGWVRRNFSAGSQWYFTESVSNFVSAKTTNFVTLVKDTVPATTFTNSIPSPVAADQYIAGGITTQLLGEVRSPIDFEMWLRRNGGNTSTIIPVHPEIYYVYQGTTNQLGDWDTPNQLVTSATFTRFTFTVSFTPPTVTGAVRVIAYLKSGTPSGSAAGLDILAGGAYDSHMNIAGYTYDDVVKIYNMANMTNWPGSVVDGNLNLNEKTFSNGVFDGSHTGSADLTNLVLNGTNMQPWQITNDPTNNMILSASVSGSVTNPVWTNAPVLAGLTMVGDINLGGGTASNGNFIGTSVSMSSYAQAPFYYPLSGSDINIALDNASRCYILGGKSGIRPWMTWTNINGTISMSTTRGKANSTNALEISAGTNLLAVGTGGPVVISNIVTATGNGAGLTNLQNTVSYLNTNNATADFSTAGGSFGTIVQNPAWTNMFNVTNRGIAVGCKRIKFAGYISTATGPQTNTFGLSWSTNTAGQTKIGAFVDKCHDETKYIYGEIPVNPDGSFYYFCSTNMNAELTITGGEF